MIRYACPECGAKMETPTDRIGKLEDCPRCGGTCTVPMPPSGLPLGAEAAPPINRQASSEDANRTTVARKQTATGANESVVVGIIGLFIAGLILGIVALLLAEKAGRSIREDPDRYEGQGAVAAGKVLGVIDLMTGMFFAIWLFSEWLS